MTFKQLRVVGKSLLAAVAAFAIIFSSITPASADGLTPFQQPTPTVTATPGTYDGDIDMKVDAGPGDPPGQTFVINLYSPDNTLVYTSASTLASGDVVTATGLQYNVDYSAIATVLAWDDPTAGISYLSADSAPATSQAAYTPPPPPSSDSTYLNWVDQSLGGFAVDTSYSDFVTADSDQSVTYSVTYGQLPDGISLDSTTGEVSGTPTTPGPYDFEITASSYPNSVSLSFNGSVEVLRGCEDYSNASFASNILLNPDGTPIGCDYQNQPTDLRPVDWENTFSQDFGVNDGQDVKYATRLGYACDDCSVGAGGVNGDPGAGGIPLGFNINFFGTTYSNVFVNSNGSIGFGNGSGIYNEPLNEVLNGSPGIAPFAVDLDNRDVSDPNEAWGPGTDRHADFFYWGRTLYDGKSAFVVTWMNSQVYENNAGPQDFNTFQIVIVDNGSGDADYILNYGSTQDFKTNAGYTAGGYPFDPGPANSCDFTICLAAGFGSTNGDTVLYASLQDSTGYLYNGSDSAEALDGASHALNQASLNSDIPGQFIYHMVSGYVPEIAVVPSQPQHFSAINTGATVDTTWDAPASIGGSPIVSYDIRYRLSGSTDPYTTVTVSGLESIIDNMVGGRYVFQVAARNEIGIGPFSRSYLVDVAGPTLANLTAYHEALNFAQSLSSDHFTPETWAPLQDALLVTVDATNTQQDVDSETLAINAALAGLVVASGTIYSFNFVDYDAAVNFANSLRQADFTSETWVDLAAALAVDRATLTDQSLIDAQTSVIQTAVNNLTLAGAGEALAVSDLSFYNSIVGIASQAFESGYTAESWAPFASALAVPITRYDSQTDVDNQAYLIISAYMGLVPVADLSAYNLAVSDASQYVGGSFSPDSWAALQDALNVPVSETDSQLSIDAATDAIYSAIAALVPYADLTDYNAAVLSANSLSSYRYTTESWSALSAALAIPIDATTNSQIYVNIATQNINSAIAALVLASGVADMTAYDSAVNQANALTQADYTSESWQALQDALVNNQSTYSDSQETVDQATASILAAISALTPADVYWADSYLKGFQLDVIYSDFVSTTSSSPTTYSIVSGALPSGISLNSETGEVSGIPDETGSYSFVIQASTRFSTLSQSFSGLVGLRGCEDYSGASYTSNILLNPDGTPIGCDYETQPTDLRPDNWDSVFNSHLGAGSTNQVRYSTRLGWACDDCSVGAGGVSDFGGGPSNPAGIPLGFNINFFGTTYSDIFVNSNGSVSFGHGSSYWNRNLSQDLDGAPGIAPFAVDLDNRDAFFDGTQAWGPGSDRHSDLFYWGRTTYEGRNAFVVTWMNSQIFQAGSHLKDFNTFQIVIVDNGSGDADYIINYGSLQDSNNNAGYNDYFGCTHSTRCLAAGFGSTSGNETVYASTQDSTGYIYNGTASSEVLDNGSHPLVQNSLNSSILGQFIYHMVSGYVPEVATVPGPPQNFSAINRDAAVNATWDPPASIGGSPILSYQVRYRLSGTSDEYTELTVTDPAAAVDNLPAGDYAFQVAARNEVGQGPFSRSYLVTVTGPALAEMTAYNEAVSFADGLIESHFTPETWSNLIAVVSSNYVTEDNSQSDVDSATDAINAAIASLVVTTGPIFSVSYVDYDLAVVFAHGLRSADFTSETWAALDDALSVDRGSLTNQSMVDAQTDLINGAINNLLLKGAGGSLPVSNLSMYNHFVAQANRINPLRYSQASAYALLVTLNVPINRYNTQEEVDAQTLLISDALDGLVPIANLNSYNLAVSDAQQLVEDNYSPDSWSALQDALAVPISETDIQGDVDAATIAIYEAISALVQYANLTDYNDELNTARNLNRDDYTTQSWAALMAALGIQVDRATNSQAYVNIATQNLRSAISSLVQKATDMTAYNSAVALALAKNHSEYTTDSWQNLQIALAYYSRTSSDRQASVDDATSGILAAIGNLVVLPRIPTLANLTHYNDTLALARTKIQLAYTADSWSNLQSVISANVRTSADTQDAVDRSTDAIERAIRALVIYVAPPPPVPSVHLLVLSQVVSLVKKNNVPVMIGAAISSPIKFATNSAKLTKATTKAITKLAAKWKTQSGSILITGFVKTKAKTSKVLKLAAARALAVAKLLFKLGVTPTVGYYGYGSPNTKKPAASANSVQIRWIAG